MIYHKILFEELKCKKVNVMNIDFSLSIYWFLKSGNKKTIDIKLFNIAVSFLVFSYDF